MTTMRPKGSTIYYLRFTIGLALVLASPARGTNDVSGDPNALALWSFEGGAGFLADTGPVATHTLTNNGAGEAGTFKELAGSADFETGDADSAAIADAALAAGFPWRSSGGSTTLSISAWIWPESLPTEASGKEAYIVSKGDTADAGSLYLWANDTEITGGFGILIGSTGGTLTGSMTPGNWYHVTWSVTATSSSSANYRLSVWDDTAGAPLAADVTGTYSNAFAPLTTNAYAFTVGAARTPSAGRISWDGLLDEVLVWNDNLSLDETSYVIAGTFPTGGGGGGGDDDSPGGAADITSQMIVIIESDD